MGQLYKITFEGTSKAYIGITTRTVQKRFAQHCESSKNTPISRAIRKYTKENTAVHVLAEADSWEDLCALEIMAIKEHNTKVPNGYNLTEGGDGTLGWDPPAEWRANRAELMTGTKHTPETLAKMSLAAKNRSEEYLAKMSKSKSVENLSAETRQKLSDVQRGKVRGNGANVSKALLSRTPEQKAESSRKMAEAWDRRRSDPEAYAESMRKRTESRAANKAKKLQITP